LQKQLDDLKALEANGGRLTSHEQRIKEELERDIKSVRKAREALGDNAPKFSTFHDDSGGRGGRGGHGGRGAYQGLGKRRRDDDSSSDSDVPDDVKAIPMPRDTPPPIPKEVLDKWYQKQRERRREMNASATNANSTPLGAERSIGRDGASVPAVPVPVQAQTVYEAKPVVRDLRREAVAAFIPAAVRAKLEKAKGRAGLVEPEDMEALEREGYAAAYKGGATQEHGGGEGHTESDVQDRQVRMEDVEDEDG
jgi:hypothetical protein